MDRFSGTVAVVTGSSVGIGAAITKSLLKRGLIVAGIARREDKLKEFKDELDKLGFKGKFYPVKCDITAEEDVIRAFDDIAKNAGKITILVNNAGVCPRVPIHVAGSEVIDSIFETNVKGTILCARQAIKIMRENSTEGHIVNLCSIAGVFGWMFKLPIGLYSASKHAVKIVSDGLRREMILEKTKIKVSNISPGLVDTEMTAGHIPDDPYEHIDVQDIANAVVAVLDTSPGVVCSRNDHRMDCAKKDVCYLKDEDCYFIENVMIDIRAYINVLNESNYKNKVLLLPPVNNFRRFLVHKLVEETFSSYNLSTLSVGKLYGRRTVIFPSKLMEKNENTTAVKPAVPEPTEDPKKKSIPIYRPPAVRKRENVARSSIVRNQDRKSRKPDQQIYIPRAKRLNCSLSDDSSAAESIQDENKSDGEIRMKSSVESVEIESKQSLYGDEDGSHNSDEVEFVGVVKQGDTENETIEISDTVNDTIEISDTASSSSITETDRIYKKSDLLFNRDESIDSKSVIRTSVDDENVPKIQPSKDTSSKQETSSTSREEVDIISLDDSSCQSVDDLDDITIDERLTLTEAAAATLEPEKPNTTDIKKTDKATKSNSQNKSLTVDDCDWEELFDESGEYVDHSLIDELMTAIGKVSVQRAAQDYRSFQTEEERSSDGECIIEVYGFPSEFRTENLFDVFTAYRSDRGFQIVWVDDTHALAVFSSPLIADEVLNTQLPFVKTRPLKNAIAKSKLKASNFTLPPATRPKTCVSLARRLVSGHLGMKIDVTPKQREAERKLLSDAREQKRLAAKQKFDAWEGSSSGGKR